MIWYQPWLYKYILFMFKLILMHTFSSIYDINIIKHLSQIKVDLSQI